MSNTKKILILSVGLSLLLGSVSWQFRSSRERFIAYMDSVISSPLDKRAEKVRNTFDERVSDVMEVYTPAVDKMRGRLEEEKQRVEDLERNINKLIEMGVTTKEEVLEMTKEEINVLIEENIINNQDNE